MGRDQQKRKEAGKETSLQTISNIANVPKTMNMLKTRPIGQRFVLSVLCHAICDGSGVGGGGVGGGGGGSGGGSDGGRGRGIPYPRIIPSS